LVATALVLITELGVPGVGLELLGVPEHDVFGLARLPQVDVVVSVCVVTVSDAVALTVTVTPPSGPTRGVIRA
jgi:hypothetical protein